MNAEAYGYMKETLEAIAVHAEGGTRKVAASCLKIVGLCEIEQAKSDERFKAFADAAGKKFVADCLAAEQP